MTYLEALDKIEESMDRELALTLVMNAEDNGSMSWHGVRVIATEVPDSLRFTYDIYTEV
jgi:hypothetical protein